MARRKISRKMPPLRQVDPSLMGTQNINNWSQANIDQNEAASFNQQFGGGTQLRTGIRGEGYIRANQYNRGAMNAAGVNPGGYGANTANTRQDRLTGATMDLNNSFQATTIPGSTHWNTGEHQLSNPNMLTDTGRGFDLNKGGSVNTTDKKGLNTFSSEIDPTDKTEFQNEVVNNVMKSDPVANLSNPVEPARPQNKFEELYKPS